MGNWSGGCSGEPLDVHLCTITGALFPRNPPSGFSSGSTSCLYFVVPLHDPARRTSPKGWRKSPHSQQQNQWYELATFFPAGESHVCPRQYDRRAGDRLRRHTAFPAAAPVVVAAAGRVGAVAQTGFCCFCTHVFGRYQSTLADDCIEIAWNLTSVHFFTAGRPTQSGCAPTRRFRARGGRVRLHYSLAGRWWWC